MLATDGNEIFYEFIPGWFNYIEVKHYSFNFLEYGNIASHNGDSQDSKWLTWEGSLDYGYYRRMRVTYNSFDAAVVRYKKFDESGSYDGIAFDRSVMRVGMILLIVLMAVGEVFIVDPYVSYNLGHGFLHGYGIGNIHNEEWKSTWNDPKGAKLRNMTEDEALGCPFRREGTR